MNRLSFLSRYPAIALGACGFVAALISVLANIMNDDIFSYLHGFIFGSILAAYLVFAKKLFWLRGGILTAFFGASWIAAFQFALYIFEWSTDLTGGVALLGTLSGALGAIIVAAGFSISYPKFRSVRTIVTTIIVGAIAGLLLVIEMEGANGPSLTLLWIGWQTAIGVSLGWNRKVFE